MLCRIKGRKYLVNADMLSKVDQCLREYGSIRKVQKRTGISSSDVRRILQVKYGNQSIFKIIKRFKNTRGRLEKILLAKKYYDQFGTMDLAGQKLNVTAGRICQLLAMGVKQRLFQFTLSWDKKVDQLILRFSRNYLKEAIRKSSSRRDLFRKMGVTYYYGEKLLKHYSLNPDFAKAKIKNRKNARKHFVKEYLRIAELLGRHPTPSELRSRGKFKRIDSGIFCCWGSMKKFRKIYGIKESVTKLTQQQRKRLSRFRLILR